MIFVWVNKRNWCYPGPIVNVGVHNAHSLAQLGYETHLCLGEGDVSDTEQDLKEVYDLTSLPHLQIHRIKKRRIGKTALSLSVFQEAEKLIKTLCLRDQVVVISRDAVFLPFLAKLRRRLSIIGLYEAHDFYADLFWRTDSLSFQDYKQELIEKLFIPQISGVISITKPQQELYQRQFSHVPTCYLPLGTKPQELGDIEARRLLRKVVYVGHLDRAKGVTDLVKLAVALGQREIKTVLWGGSPEQIQRFQNLIHGVGATQEIEYVGFRPFKELYGALKREVSLGLVPLQDTFYNRYLTCPAKALDYISHGLPVIASDLTGIRALLEESASYFNAEQPTALAEKCEKLLSSPEEYEAASRLAYERAVSLAWPQRAQQLVAFVETLKH